MARTKTGCAEPFAKSYSINAPTATDCGLGLRCHPQIAWAKLKALSDGAALASRTLWRQDATA
jgi:hypothetical protein